MNIQTSLFAKILLWFFLSLVILGGVLGLLFNQQFETIAHSLTDIQTRARMKAVSQVISHELLREDSANWNEVLERYSSAYGVSFSLVTEDGEYLAGKEVSVPNKRLEEIRLARQTRPAQRFNPEKPPLPVGPPHPQDMLPLQKPLPFGPEGGNPPLIIFETRNPTTYWAGAGMGIRLDVGLYPIPGVLFATATSRAGNAIFAEPVPWKLMVGIIIVLSILLWIPLIRSITHPIKEVTRAAGRIARGDFDVKIKTKSGDEIGQLGNSINEMASRLDGYVKGQKRFLGDVAHELATPIAKIQLGLGILEQRSYPENQERVRDVMEDATHMSNLVNELLSFSRAEFNPTKINPVAIDIDPAIDRAVDRESFRGAQVKVTGTKHLTALADSELLARAVANLVRNSIRYAGNSGPIEIRRHRNENGVVIEILDRGSGVREDLLQRLFEPFYRPDVSRVRETGGVGLGLAIVKTCIDSCQGSVHAENRNGGGFKVSITLQPGQ